MKGAYSSPDGVLDQLVRSSRCFPTTPMASTRAAIPEHIPDLTYAQFKSFHERHYHPSNARMFFYGDDDPTERLRLLDAYLSPFEPVAVDSAVALAAALRGAAAPDAHLRRRPGRRDAAKKAMVTVNWMLDEVGDIETDLGLGIPRSYPDRARRPRRCARR